MATFDLCRLRFHFRAADSLYFPQGKSGNVLRGALGMMLLSAADDQAYAQIFAPRSAGDGPSGLADQPRPFVLRAAHLDGRTIAPGAAFHFDVHLFDLREPVRTHLCQAFARAADEGLGPRRARASLERVDTENAAIDLESLAEQASSVQVRFVTPTELKADQKLVTRPEFAVLFARLRDRISTLRALYGAGPLPIDFRAMAERAARIGLARCELGWQQAERRSSRTGQTHPLGGFTGEAVYEGDLGEFLPYLRAGVWTGVGRQTVWGKGEICFQPCC